MAISPGAPRNPGSLRRAFMLLRHRMFRRTCPFPFPPSAPVVLPLGCVGGAGGLEAGDKGASLATVFFHLRRWDP